MIKLSTILNEIKLVRSPTQLKIGNKVINKSTSIPGEQPNEVRTYEWENGKKIIVHNN